MSVQPRGMAFVWGWLFVVGCPSVITEDPIACQASGGSTRQDAYSGVCNNGVTLKA